ncbi:MAG: glycosyltransferase [Clostridiales bacterium]
MNKKEKVYVIYDKQRNMNYDEIIFFHDKELIEYSNDIDIVLKNINVIIVDLVKYSDILNICNKIRLSSKLPIIIIENIEYPVDDSILLKTKGMGILKIIQIKDENKSVLYEIIQGVIEPHMDISVKKIAIILPIYNEEKRFSNVLEYYKSLKKILEEINLNISIYFINDGSNDKTKDFISELANIENQELGIINNTPFISGKNLKINTRKAGTYIEAMKEIDSDIYIFSDSDNSFLVEDIIKMVNILSKGYYDIIAGTKDKTAEKRHISRRILSFIKRILTKPILPKGIYDSQTGLKGLNKLSVQYLLPSLSATSGLAIDLELLNNAKQKKIRVLQLPVNCVDRDGSHVNIIKDSIHFLKILIKIFFKIK